MKKNFTNYLKTEKMSDKQKTAVQYLEDIALKGYISPEDFERAKELFKQQTEFMFECGRNFQMTAEGTFNQVYNETFKTESNGTT